MATKKVQKLIFNSKFYCVYTRAGRSIRVELVPEGTGLGSPGEDRETCDDITREGLTHASVAFSASP